jgi:hypothetical protein
VGVAIAIVIGDVNISVVGFALGAGENTGGDNLNVYVAGVASADNGAFVMNATARKVNEPLLCRPL